MPGTEMLNESFEVNEQEGLPTDATSFLPLMLQAQDLISKLESRVFELENDLETINEAHEHERDLLLQEIGEKDEYIHNLKTKASRLEFGAREAIIVLARTVEILKAQSLEEEDISKDDDDNATAVESNDLEGQFLDSIKLCLNYLKCTQNSQQTPKNFKKSLSQERRDSKFQPSIDDEYESDHRIEIITSQHDPLPNHVVQNDYVENDINDDVENYVNDDVENDVNDDVENDVNSKLTVPHNSSRRESFSSSQISLDDMPNLDEYDLDGSEDIADFDIPMSDDDNNNYSDNDSDNDCDNDSDNDNENDNENDNNNNLTLQYLSTPRGSIDSAFEEELARRQEYLIKFNEHQTNNFHKKSEETEDEREVESTDDDYSDDDDDDEHRLVHDSLPTPGPVPDTLQNNNICPNCNTLLSQVDQHVEERAYLKRDLSALALSLAEEQTLRSQIQNSKESLEREIDEWINAMFEKVNQMVFDEANTREELESLNRETKGKMDNSLQSSESRQDRLREMKLLLVHLDSTKQRQSVPTQNGAPLNRNSIVRRSLLSNSPANSPRSSRIFGHMSPNIFSNQFSDEIGFSKIRRLYIDSIVFEEFQEYVKALTNSPAPVNSNPTHPFMKRCMNEDIQPCLFEGHAGWKSPFYKRRLLDAIMKNQCEIQKIYYSSSNSVPCISDNNSQISSSTSNTRSISYNEPPAAPKLKCGLCGQHRSCDFRMRISGSDVAVPPLTTMTPSSRFSVTGSPGWIPLDRFCRDRVVAVCDFYTYISHLRKGLFANSPVWGMYKQCLKYRRRMSMARVGSVSMFEEEEAIINECLNNSEMEGMVVLVN
ncbi:guanyl-nucleotide exchange factor sec2 [Gigaspora margarita]|uniref:Guanyl-nucleotide exchange factor sec2 n=1 Tax=Gigaspora margarita TaxID=4874 RepID=A0A8H4ADC4_GIGMA|nr:guanyl-nucleotide exchange factor sec2 [Gigaspora margarita]